MTVSNAGTPRLEMLALSKVMERDWTRDLVERFLGEPHERRANARHPNRNPMRLYLLSDVERVETEDDFLAAFAVARDRSTIMRASNKARTERLSETILPDDVIVESVDLSDLLRAAIDRHEAFAGLRDLRSPRTTRKTHDGPFLDRICVEYAVCALVRYDRRVDGLFRRIGIVRASAVVRDRTFEAVAKTYPTLGHECERQRADPTIPFRAPWIGIR